MLFGSSSTPHPLLFLKSKVVRDGRKETVTLLKEELVILIEVMLDGQRFRLLKKEGERLRDGGREEAWLIVRLVMEQGLGQTEVVEIVPQQIRADGVQVQPSFLHCSLSWLTGTLSPSVHVWRRKIIPTSHPLILPSCYSVTVRIVLHC